MTAAPITIALAERGDWLTPDELLAATRFDFPEEHYMHAALQAHLRAGHIIPRLRDATLQLEEYGLTEWVALPPPADNLLERIQRITAAQWSRPHTHREMGIA